MDAFQFSLFFIALLVGYLLVHLRLVRFEEYLRQLAGIQSLNDRLKSISEQLEKVRLDRIENQLHRLHEDLEDLGEATTHVAEAVVRVPPAPPSVAAAIPVNASLGDRVRALVETRLLQLGYSSLNVLTDLQALPTDGDIEVLVECERNQMMSKGRIVLRNGSIRDVQLQSVANMFP